jgi:hypothetical protein
VATGSSLDGPRGEGLSDLNAGAAATDDPTPIGRLAPTAIAVRGSAYALARARPA